MNSCIPWEDEYEEFLKDIKQDDFTKENYMDISAYEDDYGNSEIEECIERLADEIRLYLCKNRPNEFIVTTGWCVFVMTPEEARKSRMSERHIAEALVKDLDQMKEHFFLRNIDIV